MRLVIGCLIGILAGCGRGALIDPQEFTVGPSKPLQWRLELEVTPERTSRLNVPIPKTVFGTVVGALPAAMEQDAVASARHFDSPASRVRAALEGTTARLVGLTLSRDFGSQGVVFSVDRVEAVVGGPWVEVNGRVMTTAGDVGDQLSFVGRLRISEEPGGAGLRLGPVREGKPVRPFDELELCAEQPLAAEDLATLELVSDGVPLSFTVSSPTALATCHRLRTRSFLWPASRLTLRGVVLRAGKAMRVPNEPQVRVAEDGVGWQLEAAARTTSLVDLLDSPSPIPAPLAVTHGATAFIRLGVPSAAGTLSLWAAPVSSTQQAPTERTSRVRLFTAPGESTTVFEARAPNRCGKDVAYPYCGAWTQLSIDVSTLRGRALYLEVPSRQAWFFEPDSDGFLVGTPEFDAR